MVKLITEVGERFPVLIESSNGLPLRVALRYGLEIRAHGGAARLEVRMRRVAELYEWCARHDIDLDLRLRSLDYLPIQAVLRAQQDLAASRSPRLSNTRITAFLDFLTFAAKPHNIKGGDFHESPSERHVRQSYTRDLDEALEARRTFIPVSKSHEPVSNRELSAIDDVLFGDPKNSPFAKTCRFRNGLIYRLARYGGVRIGEALKIKVEDLPSELGAGTALIAGLLGTAQSVQIVRRPDDPDDPRKREARVKRGDRSIELPDDLISDLLAYAKARSRDSSVSCYLFISSTDPTTPLSQSRAEKIVKQIGLKAAKLFRQRFRDVACTLESLCWHRLRTTRAIEVLPEFFPDGIETEVDKMRFIEYFGWSAFDSAKPYLKRLRARRSEAIKRQMQSELHQASKRTAKHEK